MNGFITLTPEFIVSSCSPSLPAKVYSPASDLPGQNLFAVFPECNKDEVTQLLKQVLDTQTVLTFLSGIPGLSSSSVQILPSQNGKTQSGLVLFFADPTTTYRQVFHERLVHTFKDVNQSISRADMRGLTQAFMDILLEIPGMVYVEIRNQDGFANRLAASPELLNEPAILPPLLVDRLISANTPLIETSSSLPDYRLVHPQAQSVIFMPLRVGDRLMGLLMIESNEGGPFDDSRLEILNEICISISQSLIGFERSRDFSQRLDYLSAIQEMSKGLSSARDSAEIFKAIVEKSCSILRAEFGTVLIPSTDKQLLQIADESIVNIDTSSVKYPIDGSLSGSVYKSGIPLKVDHILNNPAISQSAQETLQKSGLSDKASIIVPMIANERTIGVITMGRGADHPFTDEELQLLSTIGEMAGSALIRTHYFEDAQHRAQQLAELNDISQQLSATLDRMQAYQLTVNELAERFGFDAVFLFEPDSIGRTLSLLAKAGPGSGLIEEGKAFSTHEGILGKVFRSKKSYYTNNTRSDPFSLSLSNQVTGSELCTPVLVNGKVAAIINVEQPVEGFFSDVEVTLVETLSAQLSVTISNAQRFDRINRTAERLRKMDEMTQRLESSTSLSAVLRITLDTICDLLHAKRGVIFLLHGNQLQPTHFHNVLVTVQHELMINPISTDTGLFGKVLQTRVPVEVPDTSSEPHLVYIPGLTGSQLYSIPLIASGRPVGIIDLDVLPEDDEIRNLVNLFCIRAAFAIETARLYEETVTLAQQRAAFLEISSLLSMNLSIEKTTKVIVEQAQAALGVDGSILLVIREGGDEMEVAGISPEHLEKSLPAGSHFSYSFHPFPQHLVARNEPIFINDINATSNLSPQLLQFLVKNNILSVALVPLYVNQKPFGMLALLSEEKYRVFDESNVRMAQGIANQVSIALQRIELHQEVVRYAAELENRVALRTHELQTERDRTQAILDTAGEGITMFDLRGTIIYANRAFIEMTRYPMEEIIGNHFHHWLVLENPQDFRDSLLAKLQSENKWRGEIRVRRKDQVEYDALLVVQPILEDGKTVGYVGVQQDISAFKELDRLKSEFVSNVSHELRTPITSLKLYLDRLPQATPEQTIRYQAALQRETHRLEVLVEDLLAISRLDLGKNVPQIHPLDIVTLVQQIVDDRQMIAKSRGIQLTFTAQAPIPMALADDKFVMQIVTNILTNAINYTPAGGSVFVSVFSAGIIDNPQVGLRIQDTGVGIPPDELPHIFERFYRGGAGRAAQTPGTGLGLAIVKELVDKLRGKILVDSRVKQGTTVEVILPAEVL